MRLAILVLFADLDEMRLLESSGKTAFDLVVETEMVHEGGSHPIFVGFVDDDRQTFGGYQLV